MCNARKISIFVVVLVLLVVATRTYAASDPNASLHSSSGDLYVSDGVTAAEALASEDGMFIQLYPGASVVMKFADDSAAQPDGTDTPDLRVATVDVMYPASAEILTSEDGSVWTSLGVFEDTSDLEINLTEPALYVKIDQAQHYIDPAYPNYGFDLDAVSALNQELVRYGEITSPAEGADVSGEVTFAATLYNDDTKNHVDWAVRIDNCESGSETVLGNVDGFSDPSFFDGQFFSALGDTSEWEPGIYCFVFHPQEDAGEAEVRETRLFTVGEPDEEAFCDIGWKPPVMLEAHDVNVKATLPIKFYLEDCAGNPMRVDAEPELVVEFLGSDDYDAETFDLDWKKGTGGYLYLALFRPMYAGDYVAVVTYEGQEYEQAFTVVEHGNGKDKQLDEGKLTGQEKDKSGKPASSEKKPKGKPAGSPGKGPKKP